MIELFHYWRSSSSWRVRAALAFKKIPYKATPISLLNDETDSPSYRAINPVGAVPALKINPQETLIESLAIIRYLEQVQASPTLLPGSPVDQARIWALAELINAGTHPIQNLPVLHYYSSEPAEQKKWAKHWIAEGLKNYERVYQQYQTFSNTGQQAKPHFSYGSSLTLADLCLIPQCYNALRYEVDMTAFPQLNSIYTHCLTLSCFQESHPDRFKPVD